MAMRARSRPRLWHAWPGRCVLPRRARARKPGLDARGRRRGDGGHHRAVRGHHPRAARRGPRRRAARGRGRAHQGAAARARRAARARGTVYERAGMRWCGARLQGAEHEGAPGRGGRAPAAQRRVADHRSGASTGGRCCGGPCRRPLSGAHACDGARGRAAQAYLRGRRDTIRCIVASLTDDAQAGEAGAGESLFDELSRPADAEVRRAPRGRGREAHARAAACAGALHG
jgi:hypothetical protein